MRATPELERFIRNTLGCGCPDEVFESVTVTRGLLAADGDESAWWIEVGGRLLIAVTENSDQDALTSRLTRIYDDATRRRDAAGFNRFRLVVVADKAMTGLETAFTSIGVSDDRLHLHFVTADDLPSLTITHHAESQ